MFIFPYNLSLAPTFPFNVCLAFDSADTSPHRDGAFYLAEHGKACTGQTYALSFQLIALAADSRRLLQPEQFERLVDVMATVLALALPQNLLIESVHFDQRTEPLYGVAIPLPTTIPVLRPGCKAPIRGGMTAFVDALTRRGHAAPYGNTDRKGNPMSLYSNVVSLTPTFPINLHLVFSPTTLEKYDGTFLITEENPVMANRGGVMIAFRFASSENDGAIKIQADQFDQLVDVMATALTTPLPRNLMINSLQFNPQIEHLYGIRITQPNLIPIMRQGKAPGVNGGLAVFSGLKLHQSGLYGVAHNPAGASHFDPRARFGESLFSAKNSPQRPNAVLAALHNMTQLINHQQVMLSEQQAKLDAMGTQLADIQRKLDAKA